MTYAQVKHASSHDWFIMYDLKLGGIWCDTKLGFSIFFSDYEKLLKWAGY